MTRLILTALLLLSSISAHADTGCTIAQVSKTLHADRTLRHYEYASDYFGDQKPPTFKPRKRTDQYLFWVERNGTTYPAIVTYPSGKCTGGVAVVKVEQGE